MRRGTPLALALLGFAAGPLHAVGPTFTLSPERVLLLGELPAILERPEVRPHLNSGLTTGLVIGVTFADPDGRKARGAAQVDVRWEPWDEVFLVTVRGADGRARRQSLPSFEALAAWWRGLELPVATGLRSGPRTLDVDLRVLPFSHSEQRDAQRWFLGTLAPETSGDAPAGAAPDGAAPSGVTSGESRLAGVIDLLMATSIQRRALVRYTWRATPRPASR